MLAGGFVLSAIAQMRAAVTTPKTLGRASLPAGVNDGSNGVAREKRYDVKDIDERAALVSDLIRKASLNPQFHEHVVKMVSQKCDMLGRVDNQNGTRWCVAEKDCVGEAKAVFNNIRSPRSKYGMRYVRDNLIADVFTAGERTLLITHGGDCDDFTIVLGGAMLTIGHPVRMRIVATRRQDVSDAIAPWSHIYLLTPMQFDNPNAQWVAMGAPRRLFADKAGKGDGSLAWTTMDGSMDKPFGWEAPGAREVAASGKAAGIIARVRDYNVVDPSEEQ